MDLIQGTDLRRLLAAQGPLPSGAALSVTAEVLEALAVVHAAGIIHRDVKPENVLIDRSRHAYLTDFGIARITDGHPMSHFTGSIGTPEYMAPEMAEHTGGGPAVDLYGIGVLLYELLTGTTPFAGGHPVAILNRHIHDAPQRLPGISDETWVLVSAMLAKNPAARPTASAAARACRHLIASGESGAITRGTAPPPPPPPVMATPASVTPRPEPSVPESTILRPGRVSPKRQSDPAPVKRGLTPLWQRKSAVITPKMSSATIGSTGSDLQPSGASLAPTSSMAVSTALPSIWGIPKRVVIACGVIVGILVVILVAYAGLSSYAHDGWFVTTNGRQLVIYQGRPGGILWFHPRLADRTRVTTADVLPTRVSALQRDVVEPSLNDARQYVENLHQEFISQQAIIHPSTTTTTVVGPTLTPATTPTGTVIPNTPTAIATAFINYLAQGNYFAAYYLTSLGFQAKNTVSQFTSAMAYATGNNAVVSKVQSQIVDGVTVVTGQLVVHGTSYSFSGRMVQDGGQWRFDNIYFN